MEAECPSVAADFDDPESRLLKKNPEASFGKISQVTRPQVPPAPAGPAGPRPVNVRGDAAQATARGQKGEGLGDRLGRAGRVLDEIDHGHDLE